VKKRLVNFFWKAVNRLLGYGPLTRESAMRECKRNFNHIGVYAGYEVCRLIGFGDDGEDFYYITIDPSGKVVWSSMAGGFYSIKGMERRGYRYIECNFRRYAPPAKKFIVEIFEPEAA
jgi:hypothetical protein